MREPRWGDSLRQSHLHLTIALVYVLTQAFVLIHVRGFWVHGVSRTLLINPLPWVATEGPELLSRSFLVVNVLFVVWLWTKLRMELARNVAASRLYLTSHLLLAVAIALAQLLSSRIEPDFVYTLTRVYP